MGYQCVAKEHISVGAISPRARRRFVTSDYAVELQLQVSQCDFDPGGIIQLTKYCEQQRVGVYRFGCCKPVLDCLIVRSALNMPFLM